LTSSSDRAEARSKTEDILRKSEEKYRTLFETMTQGVVYQDGDGKIVSANPAAERILGLTLDQMQGRTSMDPRWKAIHEDGSGFPGDTHPAMVAMRTGKEVRNVIMGVFDPKTGKHKWININAVPEFRPGETKPLQVYTTFDDITGLKQIEERVRDSERKYRNLVENSKDSITMIDMKGNVLFGNKATEALTGYSATEGARMNVRDITPLRYWPRSLEMLLRARTGKPIPYFESVIRRKDGQLVPVESGGQAILHDGKVVGIQIITRDITERRRMEDELREYSTRLKQLVDERTRALQESEKKYRSLVENIPDVTWTIDRNGNTAFISSNVEKVEGYTPEEIYAGGHALWFERVHPDDLSRVKKALESLFTAGEMYDVEYRIRRKDGNWIWVQERAVATYERDGERYADGVYSEITERKRLEDALLKSQRMAAIGELAAMVGHDLRNPLTGITGATYYLKKKLGSKTNKKEREMLQLIDQEIDHSDKIVNDLLEYSGEIRLELAQTDAKSITRNALKSMKIPSRIHLLDSTKEEPKIELDADKMRRVFGNLIRNAVDAMPERGTLRITSRESNGNLKLSITDTGTGMTKETVERLWVPLFTTKAKGIGLGLPIAKRLVEAHGGSITVETKPNKGSTFTVTLPLNRRREG